jgi:hypothetical protein
MTARMATNFLRLGLCRLLHRYLWVGGPLPPLGVVALPKGLGDSTCRSLPS